MATKPAAKPKTSVEKQILYIREHYGFLAGFLNIPEIRAILLRAGSLAQQGKPISDAVLQGQIYATKWWKTTAEVTRQWTALEANDPATARKRIEDTMRDIRNMATAQGVRLDQKQLKAYATQVNKYGWSTEQVAQGVTSHLIYDSDKAATGQAAITADRLKSIAGEYLIPVSDATIQKWARDVGSGQVDVNSFVGYAQQQAKSRWPGLADAIDRGVTPEQYTNTYRETIAHELEQDPDSIDLTSPRWNKIIDSVDPKTGVHSAMTLSDTVTYARKQPEWKSTRAAKDKAASLITGLGKVFGETL